MKKVMRAHKAILLKGIVIMVAILLIVKILDHYGSTDSPPEYPDYEQVDLDEAINFHNVYKGRMDEETEKMLFLQTGLGEEGIQTLLEESDSSADFYSDIKEYQEQLFSGTGIKNMVTLKDGDVLVSMSQRLCYYPHGHAAIVIDGEENRILEARSYVAGSCVCKQEKWSKLSSFVVLRVKEEVTEEFIEKENEDPAESAAVYAAENLDGLKYSLLKDLRPLSDTTPEYTQCAHLVWYAYYANGLDIDENRGIIIKPKDFLKSDVLEIVQVFGINPKDLLELRNE